MTQWLVPAVGIALSPLPTIAMLLVLGGRRSVVNGLAFWSAWTVGIASATTAFVVVAERAHGTDDELTAITVAEIAIGVAFLAVVARLGFGRRRERSNASPRWLDALDRSGPLRTAALALILSSGNPKNLALMLAAAAAIVRDGQPAVGVAGFVALAVSIVSLLLVSQIAFSSRTASTLQRLRGGIARNDHSIAIVVGLVVGAFFLADGIRNL
jgi:threonine/homoserine/homoserine lactone efflux protein